MSVKLTALGEIASRFSVQTPPLFWVDLYTEISAIASYDGDWEQMIEERIAGLTEMRRRYYEIAALTEETDG